MRLINLDDYIESINESIKEAYKWYDECRTDEVKIRAEQAIATFCEASLRAKKMPIVEAEPVRHGHWEVVDETEPRRYGCSECKRLSYSMDNHCSGCGAKMDEVEE